MLKEQKEEHVKFLEKTSKQFKTVDRTLKNDIEQSIDELKLQTDSLE